MSKHNSSDPAKFELNSEAPAKPKRTEFGTTFIGDAVKANWIAIALLLRSVFVTAAQVLYALHHLNIRYSLDGTRLVKANAVGDALGVKGLNLPASSPPKRFYYLPAVEMTAEERDAYASLSAFKILSLADAKWEEITANAEAASLAEQTKPEDLHDDDFKSESIDEAA